MDINVEWMSPSYVERANFKIGEETEFKSYSNISKI